MVMVFFDKDMVVLITGVSSGFGKAMALRLASDGHKVYGTVRRDVEPLAGVTYLKADVRDEASVAAAFSELSLREGRIDVFVSNAGVGIGGPLEFCSVEDISRLMDVNFMGMARWMSHVIPAMRRQGSGKILCVSSIGGLMGLPYQGAYSASKFAVEGYCEALRLELRGTGVSVTVIEPGDFATGFTVNRETVCPEDVADAYPSYGRSLRGIEKDENSGLRPEFLARKVSGIVKKKRPAYRYVISSFVQRLSIFAKWILPAPVFAWILALYYKL